MKHRKVDMQEQFKLYFNTDCHAGKLLGSQRVSALQSNLIEGISTRNINEKRNIKRR